MDPEEIEDLFAAFGRVRVRRMFGGSGIYADGLMFALESGGALYLKADEAFGVMLERRGSAPFSYEARGQRRTIASFWRVPEEALDDGEELASLSRRALEVARTVAEGRARDGRSPARKPRGRKPGGAEEA